MGIERRGDGVEHPGRAPGQARRRREVGGDVLREAAELPGGRAVAQRDRATVIAAVSSKNGTTPARFISAKSMGNSK